MSTSLKPNGLQHTRLPCLSLSSVVCSNSCPLNQWWHPTISSSVTPFSSCFSLSQHQGLYQWVNSASGGLSIRASASASVLPVNIQGWFPLGLTIQRTLKSFLQHHSLKASILWHSAFFIVQLSDLYMTTGNTIALTIFTYIKHIWHILDITAYKHILYYVTIYKNICMVYILLLHCA